MKRDIKRIRLLRSCCPGHDDFPDDTYKNRRSKKARARGIKYEHRYFRRVSKYTLKLEVAE